MTLFLFTDRSVLFQVFVCATQPTNLRAATDSVFLKTGCVMVLMIAEMVATKPQTVDPDAVSITIESCDFGTVAFFD